MFQQAPTFLTAFFAGIVSFMTPCVLPLVPGYISFISGVSLNELQSGEEEDKLKRLLPVLVTTLAFTIGFSIIFVAGGTGLYFLGEALKENKDWLIRIGGVVIIILGLHMAGAFKIKGLYQEKRFQGGKGGSIPKAFVLGIAFAFGWTPCVGPILGGIMGLAAKQEDLSHAVALMVLYSAGMAIPFFLTGLAVDTFFKAFDRIKVHFRKIEIVAGSLLVIIGFMMVINRFEYLKLLFLRILPDAVNKLG